MRVCALVFAVMAAALPSLPGAGGNLTGDLATLQGKWRTWFAADDYLVFEVNAKSFSMVRHTDGKQTEAWTGSLILDETRSPRHLTWTEGKSAGQAMPDNKCIYEIHGNTWLLVGGGADNRPEHFYSGVGGGNKTWVLKREKQGK